MNAVARSLVKAASTKKVLRRRYFDTSNIISLVQEVLVTDADDTQVLAKQFSPTYEGLRQLFYYAAERFDYVEDPPGAQWVQTPSYLHHISLEGDCKSFTTYLGSTIRNMGLKLIVRYVHYQRGSDPKHVYPIAVLPSGQKVVLDLAYHKQEGGGFDDEKKFNFKIDKHMDGGLYKLGNTAVNQINQSADQLEKVMASIPDSVITEGPGDITKMTSGQLDRLVIAERFEILSAQANNTTDREQFRTAKRAIESGSIAGIGSLRNDKLGREVELFLSKTARDNKPAFSPVQLTIIPPSELAGLKRFFKKIGKGAKKAVNKVVDIAKKAFTKLVNWIWKGPADKMAPYFIFLWAKNHKNKEVRRRAAAQQKSFDFIKRMGKFSDDKLKGKVYNSVKKKFGKTPTQLINNPNIGTAELGSVTAIVAAVFKAIGFVIEVIKKIIALFKKAKKSDAGNISKDNASDLSLITAESDQSWEQREKERLRRAAGGRSGGFADHLKDKIPGQRTDSSSGMGVGLAAAAAAALFLIAG